ncbi:MAG: response regulator [Woeseiaceae bacterium]|nr:response regulator [Woeseiaceae bacterium]
MLTREKDRINLLLVEDCYSNVGVIRSALEAAGTHCRLQTVGVGADVLSYLRKAEPYANAPTPDLLLFDLSVGDSDSFRLLEQIRSDPQVAAIPVVLLIDQGDEQLLDKLATEGREGTVFSPIDLASFVKAMNSFRLDRFVHAVKLIGSLGYVLVTLPSADIGETLPA